MHLHRGLFFKSVHYFEQFLYYFFNYPQLVRVATGLCIKDASMVYAVYSYFSEGVNNIVVFQNNAYMIYFSFRIVKKGEIAWFTFFNKT